MKKLALFLLLLAVISFAFPWSRYDLNQHAYLRPAENESQSKLDEMQRRLDQSEFERQLELEEIKAAAQEAADAARQEAEELVEKAKQEAEDRAAELENRERIFAASHRNFTYGIFSLILFGLSLYKIGKDKRRNEENILNTHEKAGVVIAITGVMISLIVLFVSSPWIPQLDIWQNLMHDNLMSLMYLDFWPYVITPKFVLLPCIALILYGVMAYFEILKAPKFLLHILGR